MEILYTQPISLYKNVVVLINSNGKKWSHLQYQIVSFLYKNITMESFSYMNSFFFLTKLWKGFLFALVEVKVITVKNGVFK